MPAASPTAPVYDLHGIRVRSTIALAPGRMRGPRWDLELAWGRARSIPPTPPPGEVLARRSFGDGRGYSLTQDGAGATARFDGLCDFRLDGSGRRVWAHPSPTVERRLVPLLFAGTGIALLLGLRGEHPLHASAVAWPEGALAFLGGAGSGKSTLAALCCAAGARPVTDDLLRLEPAGEGFRCVPGPAGLRLRPNATGLASALPAVRRAPTVDGRLALYVPPTRGRPPLRALVLPRPARGCASLTAQRVPPARALFLLDSHTRISGWTDEACIRARFAACRQVALRVPLYEAVIPWGPPFAEGLAAELGRAVGLAGTGEEAAP